MNDNFTKIEIQQKQLQQKINYLISAQHTQSQQFTQSEKDKILATINFVDELKNQGATSTDLLQQLEYLQDIYSFQAIEDELYPDGTEQVGTHYNFYIFTHDGRREFDRHRLRIEEFGTFTSPTVSIFRQGYILIECQPQKMYARKDDILIQTGNELSDWVVKKKESGVELSISILPGTIQCQNDQLINGNVTRDVFDDQYVYLYYEYQDNDTVIVSPMKMIVDLSEAVVSVNYHNSSTFQASEFDQVLSNVPYNVYNYAIGFHPKSNNEQKQFENLLVTQKLHEFLDTMYVSFMNYASKDPINSLYGQTSSVALSQLYEQLSTTISRKDAHYELTQIAQSESLLPNEQLPSFKNTIPEMLRDNVNFFGQSWASLFAHKASIGGVNMYYPFKPRLTDNFRLTEYAETGAVVKTNYDLPNWRVSTQKFQMTQYVDGKQYPDTIGWIEYAQQNVTWKSTRKGSWLVANEKNYTVQPDGILDVVDGKVNLKGMRLSVDIYDSWMPDSKKYPIVFGYETEYETTQQIKVVVSPPNLSIDGSPTSLTSTITYSIDGVKATKTLMLQKQQILYGNTTRPVYIGTLDTVTKRVVYVSGWTAMAEFADTPLFQLEYLGRENGIPSNPQNANSVNMKKRIKWPYAEQTIYQANSVGYTGEGPTPKSHRLFSGYCTKDMGDTLCTMFPPFFPPQSVEYLPTFDFVPNKTRFGYEMAVLFGKSNSSPTTNNLWMEKPITYIPTLSSATSEYNGFSTSEGFQPSYYRKTSTDYPAITDFWYYGDLQVTEPEWTNDVKGYTITQVDSQGKVSVIIEKYEIDARDLILPGGITSQVEIAESIVRLNSAVELLQYYATYLNILIDNLDERLTYVENTLQEVINILNSMLAQQANSALGSASNIVNFLGVGIGMFFPLIGLGVSLIGGILKSVDTIKNGDVVAGVLDMVVGGVMASLGTYKWSKRLKQKYGNVDQKVAELPPEKRQEVVRDPGYGVINPRQPKSSTKMAASNGMFHNTSYDYEYDNATNKFLESKLTTRMVKQSPTWALIDWDQVDGWETSYQSVWIKKMESNARLSTIERHFIQVGLDDDGFPAEYEMLQDDMCQLFDVNASIHDVVQLDFLYSLCYAQCNGNIGIDDDIYNMITLANGYQTNQSASPNFRSVKSKTWKHALIRSTNVNSRHINRKWKMRSTKISSMNREVGLVNNMPVSPLSIFTNGLDPFIQSVDAQTIMFENVVQVLN